MAAPLDDAGGVSLRLKVNGEERVFPPLSLASLIESLGFEARKVAVERNRAIVPRSRLAETFPADGDWIEIVHFVGGG
jgi:thiamine biosynthesis protein ThiS